jgi:hypothetical protein
VRGAVRVDDSRVIARLQQQVVGPFTSKDRPFPQSSALGIVPVLHFHPKINRIERNFPAGTGFRAEQRQSAPAAREVAERGIFRRAHGIAQPYAQSILRQGCDGLAARSSAWLLPVSRARA